MTEPVATNSFVWIRLVDNGKSAKLAVGKMQVVLDEKELVAFGGPRPPDSGTAVRSRGGEPPASVFTTDVWHSGLESVDSSFDLGPAFDDQQVARDWIRSDEGIDWAKDAINYFLLIHLQQSPRDYLLVKNDPMPSKDPPADTFPSGDWDPLLLATVKLTAAQGPYIGDERIELAVPEQFGKMDTIKLLAYKEEREPNRKDIDFEAQGLDQVTYKMLQVVGLATDSPVNAILKAFRSAVLHAIEPVLWHYKLREPQQPRPRQLDAAIEPEFERPHWRNAGHPSFPGGHATVAYTWATLLVHAFSDSKDKLFDMAEEIAKRREIAGLHFSRDTLAGKTLGEAIGAAILKSANTEPNSPLHAGLKELRRLSRLARQ